LSIAGKAGIISLVYRGCGAVAAEVKELFRHTAEERVQSVFFGQILFYLKVKGFSITD
jgi:hypothetical protein